MFKRLQRGDIFVPGALIQLLAMFLWILTVLKEFQCTLQLGVAVWRRRSLKTYFYVDHAGTIVMESIGYLRVAGMFFFVVVTRLWIACILAYAGFQFIQVNDTMEDIILNAI